MNNYSLSRAQLERLKFIEQVVYVQGFINREDLQEQFGISAAASTKDLSMYNNLAADNIKYNVRRKCYEIGKPFRHIFAPSLLYERMPVYTMPKLHRFAIENSLDKISEISIAIQNVKPLQIAYSSASSGPSSRQIVPVAFADNLLRWHLRAYDRKRKKFTDFVVHRIESAKCLYKNEVAEHESPDNDEEWRTFVKLKIKTHPRNLEFGDFFEMGDQIREIDIRAAMTGYFLQIWNIDCSPNASMEGKQFQFFLANINEVSKHADLTLAPGYISESSQQSTVGRQ